LILEIETTIIGTGVIGLAVAAKISEQYKDIFLLEYNDRFGYKISNRNSEVIHAVIFYPKDSLKPVYVWKATSIFTDCVNPREFPIADAAR
jgi:L-2-hydroxyglutarate oxidase LhgO